MTASTDGSKQIPHPAGAEFGMTASLEWDVMPGGFAARHHTHLIIMVSTSFRVPPSAGLGICMRKDRSFACSNVHTTHQLPKHLNNSTSPWLQTDGSFTQVFCPPYPIRQLYRIIRNQQRIYRTSGICFTFAIASRQQGTLAQPVQSACFTDMRPLVRIQYVPQSEIQRLVIFRFCMPC
jgi:hypothetical protein